MTFYLKYRPQTLEDLDSDKVRESLKKIIKSKSIPHAFLFSGPKGTGKTSAARILAKVVNCDKRRANSVEPCNKCEQCKSIAMGGNIDVIELDAASHRGIDDIRALRDAVKLATAKANKKVYIIDEAHMLTTEASNALLKTLEEPPQHVMFILATTNPEKLIETIRSRAVNIQFKKAAEKEISRSLQKIVKGEKLKIGEDSLSLIARVVDGSFRDAAKILEQLVSESRKLDKESVEKFLFGKATGSVDTLVSCLIKKNTKKALSEVGKIIESGSSMRQFIESTLNVLRNALLQKVGLEQEDVHDDTKFLSKRDLIELIRIFSRASQELPLAVFEQIPVELAIIEWCEDKEESNVNDAGETGETEEQEQKISNVSGGKDGKSRQSNSGFSNSVQVKKNGPHAISNKKLSEVTDEVWKKILYAARSKNTSTEALLRAAKPVGYDGKMLTLEVYYSFHKERLESSQHRLILEETAMQIIGNPVRVNCVLTQQPARKQKESDELVLTEDKDEDIIKVAEEIFRN